MQSANTTHSTSLASVALQEGEQRFRFDITFVPDQADLADGSSQYQLYLSIASGLEGCFSATNGHYEVDSKHNVSCQICDMNSMGIVYSRMKALILRACCLGESTDYCISSTSDFSDRILGGIYLMLFNSAGQFNKDGILSEKWALEHPGNIGTRLFEITVKLA